MIFIDRVDAGCQLAKLLGNYATRNDVLVLGIPRGGVRVAYEVARALHAPLDILLSRKLGVPGQEELAFGAIAAGDGRYLDQRVIWATGISQEEIERVTQEVTKALRQRAMLYRGSRSSLAVTGKTVILVDDGIATGASVYAAINALRQMHPARIVLAVPVAPASTYAWLKNEVDELICVHAPEQFYAVGQFYESFPQVDDEEVKKLLEQGGQVREMKRSIAEISQSASENKITINLDAIQLEGILNLPNDAQSIVVFVHGSGSSRHSPRNRYVARMLQARGFATLLFDLLTIEEEALDHAGAELRFNIEMLTKRLIEVTEWITHQPFIRALPIDYFGASTGAAAALAAAAQLPGQIAAIVSRGGRPDLAGSLLGAVRAPVLLIVGSNDEIVLGLNRQALSRLSSPDKQLAIVPGATHLFEEAGALEKVAELAGDWFSHARQTQHPSRESSAS